MDRREHQTINLTLHDIEGLFRAPVLDPFHGQFHALSGVEQIQAELQPRRLVRPLHVTISIPPDRLSDGLEERAKTALQGYSASRIQQIDHERGRVNRQGFRELQLGLLFLAVCLLVSGWIEVLDSIPTFLQHFSSEGLIIVGWIALWHPVDLLLFERWILLRDRRMYRCIYDMELTVQAIPSAAMSATTATGP